MDTLGANIREDVITSDDEVLSFTSLTSDVILLINGDNNLISQDVFDWVASVVLDLQLTKLVHNSIELYSPIEHVFEKSQKILSPYLNTLFFITSLANVSTFIMIESTRFFYNSWNEAFTTNSSSAALLAYNSTMQYTMDHISQLTYFQYLLSFNEEWHSHLKDFFSQKAQPDNYNATFSSIKSSAIMWFTDIDPNLTPYLNQLLTTMDPITEWTETYLYTALVKILFGSTSALFYDQLKENFMGGEVLRHISMLIEKLIPFIRGEYMPPGFSREIREFYVSSFTNSNGSSLPTSMIIQLSVRGNLTRAEIYEFLDFMDQYSKDLSKNNPFEYEVVLVSQLFYVKERGENLSKQFRIVDILAFIIGFFLLLLLFRDLKYSTLIVTIAYSTVQVANGVIISIIPMFMLLQDSSFSIATSIVMGATMNYCVFFAYRFREEKKSGYKKAVEQSMKTALHSIQISSIALVLTFLPLAFSSINLFSGLAFATLIGILTSIGLVSLLLPSSFFLLGKSLPQQRTDTQRTYSFTFKPHYVDRVIIISILFFLFMGIYVINSGTTMAVEDFIGSEGQTGRGMSIVKEEYPDDYFSKILVQLNLSEPVFFDPGNSSQLIGEVEELSSSLNATKYLRNVISIAWPLGRPFNFDNESVALVPRESAEKVADQLVNQYRNQTFVFLHLNFPSDTPEALTATREIKNLINSFTGSSLYLSQPKYYGALADSEEGLQYLITELPYQIIFAVVMLTVFLFFQLRNLSVPLRLEFTIVLSTVIALGLGTMIWMVITGNPLNLMINLLSLIVLLGLGTDFDIFIYRRIQEEKFKQISYIDAINRGIQSSSPAVIASGSVMAASFVALFWGNIGLTRQFGLVTFIAIVIDIFLVRIFLVPALLLFKERHS